MAGAYVIAPLCWYILPGVKFLCFCEINPILKPQPWFQSSANVTKFGLIQLTLLGPYSKHLILFVTYDRAQYARALHYTRLGRFVRDKLFSHL
jgi:hypothetical protein